MQIGWKPIRSLEKVLKRNLIRANLNHSVERFRSLTQIGYKSDLFHFSPGVRFEHTTRIFIKVSFFKATREEEGEEGFFNLKCQLHGADIVDWNYNLKIKLFLLQKLWTRFS